MRLIDVDELLEILRIMQEVYFDRKIILGKVVEEVKRMPTIDPTKKGEWLQNPDDTAGEPFYICSQCGHGSYDITKFCTYCGSLNGGD